MMDDEKEEKLDILGLIAAVREAETLTANGRAIRKQMLQFLYNYLYEL